jgi:cytochrome P450
VVLVNDPDAAHRIFFDHGRFVSHEHWLNASAAHHEAIVTLEGPQWYHQRKVVARAFLPQNQRAFLRAADATLSDYLRGLLRGAAAGDVVDFDVVAFMSLYCNVAAAAMFSVDCLAVDALLAGRKSDLLVDADHVFAALERLVTIPKHLWPLLVDRATLARLKESSRRCHALAFDMLAARKGGVLPAATLAERARLAGDAKAYPFRQLPRAEGVADFLDVMIEAQREEEAEAAASAAAAAAAGDGVARASAPPVSSNSTGALTDAQIAGNAISLIIASTETSAHTTSWLLWAVLRFARGASAPTSLEELSEAHLYGSLGEGAAAKGADGVRGPLHGGAPWRTEAGAGEGAFPDTPVWDRIRAEVAAVVGPTLDSPLRWEHLERLQYVEGCIRETLRLYNTVPFIGRQATEDCEVGGLHIPKGTVLAFNAPAMHTDEANYAHPFRFVPERWMAPRGSGNDAAAATNAGGSAAGAVAASAAAMTDAEEPCVELEPGLSVPVSALRLKAAKGGFAAFGGGPKTCIGSKTAILQIKAAIVRFAQAFSHLRLAPGTPPVVPLTTVTVRPRSSIKMQGKVA